MEDWSLGCVKDKCPVVAIFNLGPVDVLPDLPTLQEKSTRYALQLEPYKGSAAKT